MGVKVVVRPDESIPRALRRLKKLMEIHRAPARPIRRKGPYRWMFLTREHHQKPGLVKRIRQVRKQLRARQTPRQAHVP
jgi:hypothetical protein